MSVNKFICIGGISRDAEVRQVGQNTVAKFGIATTEKWKKQDGTLGEETTYHNIELWGMTGIHPYLKKGTQVYVEGAYKSNDWTDNQGIKHRDYFVKASSIQLVGGRPQTAPAQAPAPQYQQPAPPPQYAAPNPPAPAYQAPATPPPAYTAPAPATPITPNTPYPQPQDGDFPFD